MTRRRPKSKNDPETVAAVSALTPLWRCLLYFVALSAATLICASVIFPPRDIWPLTFVCLAPWTYAICAVRRPWVAHWGSFALGYVFFAVNLNWLEPVTGLGYVALAFYLALYWPLTAWAVRTGRRAGISPVWTLPVAWVACEFLRGLVMTGFPWLFLAHAFYKHLAFIQISDVVGAYGVTFIAAMVNGLIAEWLLRWRPPSGEKRRWRSAVIGLAATALILIGNTFYGKHCLDDADFDDGPRVAVIQEDFPLRSSPPYSEHPYVIFSRYLALAAEAAREEPDLIAFPETVWTATQNIEFVERELGDADAMPSGTWSYGKLCHQATAAFARGDYPETNRVIAHFENQLNRSKSGESRRRLPRLPAEGGPPVTMVVGSVSLEVHPEEAYPKQKRFNSALIYDENGRQRRERYDKMHLVPFGEIVPFRNTRVLGLDLHWLYRWLNRLSPFSNGGEIEYSLFSGENSTIFNLETNGTVTRFGTPICYEDTVPPVMRSFVWGGGRRRADFLVNISNDGWFEHSEELPQHLAICVFRAVENRVGIARAVNTGISGFIDPSGRLYSLVEKDGELYAPGVVGYQIDHVKLDRRDSVYGRLGDLFAIGCLCGASALWAGAVITRWILAARNRLAARAARKRGA